MNHEIAAVELQFIKLNQQILVEKELFNSFNMQTNKIQDRTLNIKENIKVKNSLKLSTLSGTECSENNIQSLQTSIDVTNKLENEMDKTMELQNREIQKRTLAERLLNYTKQWNEVQNIYTKLPMANDTLETQIVTRKLMLEEQYKMQEKINVKKCTTKLKNITENKIKVQMVDAVKLLTKNKESIKRKLDERQKISSLKSCNKKRKVEYSSVIGNQNHAINSNLGYRKKHIVDGFSIPSSKCVLGKKYKASNIHQKPSLSLGSVATLKVPNLITYPSDSVYYKYSTPSKLNLLPNPRNGHSSCNISDENTNILHKNKTGEELSIPNSYININTQKDEALHSMKSACFLSRQRTSKFPSRPIINSTNGTGNFSNDSSKDINQISEKTSPHIRSSLQKCLPNTVHELPSEIKSAPETTLGIDLSNFGRQKRHLPSINQKNCPTETNLNFKTKGFTRNLENGKVDVKSKSKNVWDIFN